jgi:hypothetical protein
MRRRHVVALRVRAEHRDRHGVLPAARHLADRLALAYRRSDRAEARCRTARSARRLTAAEQSYLVQVATAKLVPGVI